MHETIEKAYERALLFLERRDRTEKEVTDKLAGLGFSEEIVSETVERLRDIGLVNDEDYAVRYLEALTAKGRGRLRIVSEMRRKGLPEELVRNTLEDGVSAEDERARALAAARKALASVSAETEPGKAASKVNRRLVSLGYTYSVIGEVMDELRRERAEE